MIDHSTSCSERGLTLPVLDKLTAQVLCADKSDKVSFNMSKHTYKIISDQMCLKALAASLRSTFGNLWEPQGAILLMADSWLE